MSEVSSEEVLNAAFTHVFNSRKKDSHNSDIFDLSFHGQRHKERIRTQLLSGDYLLSPVSIFKGKDDKYYSRWLAQDAVVLKAL